MSIVKISVKIIDRKNTHIIIYNNGQKAIRRSA